MWPSCGVRCYKASVSPKSLQQASGKSNPLILPRLCHNPMPCVTINRQNDEPCYQYINQPSQLKYFMPTTTTIMRCQHHCNKSHVPLYDLCLLHTAQLPLCLLDNKLERRPGTPFPPFLEILLFPQESARAETNHSMFCLWLPGMFLRTEGYVAKKCPGEKERETKCPR